MEYTLRVKLFRKVACGFFAFVGLTFTATFLSGCGTLDPEYRTYPWTVVLMMRFTLPSGDTNQSAIDNVLSYIDDDVLYGVDARGSVGQSGSSLLVELRFTHTCDNDCEEVCARNFYNFSNFFSLDTDSETLNNIVLFEWTESLFFFERTQTFKNPWIMAQGGDMSSIHRVETRVRSQFTNIGENFEKFYVFQSAIRRSTMDNAYRSENMISHFNYFFRSCGETAVQEIVIFDRFANQPMWYIIAVGGRVVFMTGFYFILRPRKVRQDDLTSL